MGHAHPGRSVPLLGDALPRPVQRRQALRLLDAFPWDRYRRVRHVCAEGKQGRAAFLNDEHVRAEWHDWRTSLIRRYRLDGLTAGDEEGEPADRMSAGIE